MPSKVSRKGKLPVAQIVALFLPVALFVVGGCDGGNDVNVGPTADAMVLADTVDLGTSVTLNGTGSTDPEGDPLEFSWTFLSVPPGSSCSIENPTSAVASFTPDKPGSYRVQLTVSDGKATDSAESTVAINGPPIADAGPDRSVGAGQSVVLDGSGSHDPNGDDLKFQWTFRSMPSGSQAFLSDSRAATTGFTADRGGSYVVELVVDDGRLASEPDLVTISVNSAPVADAGPDTSVWVGRFVQLDGSGCKDPDGDPLSYAWSFVSRPSGSAAALSHADSKNPGFSPDLPGDFVLTLTVSDGKTISDPDYVTVTARTNHPPVAEAGSYSACGVGETVQLDGTGSYDPDGQGLTYTWSVASRPPGSGAQLSDPASPLPTFTPDVSGSYGVRLLVSDGILDSEPAFATIVVNSPPVADAGPDQTVDAGSAVSLDGTGSWDPDGDLLDFAWSFASHPFGSDAELSDTTVAQPSFLADVPGTFVLSLVVSDGIATSAPDQVSVTVRQGAPTEITAFSGSGQTGTVQEELPSPLVAAVKDVHGNPVPGVAVRWDTPQGGGSLSPGESVTNADGRASANWILGKVVGQQTATASVSGLSPAFFFATAVSSGVATVEVLPASASVSVGSSVQLRAIARTSTGQKIPGAAFAWSSSVPSIASVDQSGTVTGVSAGTATISASASGVTGTSSVSVSEGNLTIETFSPSPLVEGQPATITGYGFSVVASENQVTVDGLPAHVESASDTELHITVPVSDCWPPRSATLVVTRGDAEGSVVVMVRPATLYDLDEGHGVLLSDASACLDLAGGAADAEYLIGILSASEDPSAFSAVALRARGGISLPTPSSATLAESPGVLFEVERPPARPTAGLTFRDLIPEQGVAREGQGRWAAHWAAEAERRRQEKELIQSLGGLNRLRDAIQAGPPPAARVPQPVPAVGDTVALYYGSGCTTRPSLDAAVRYVGEAAVWLEDVENPGPALVPSELQDLDSFLTSKTFPVLESHFGPLADVDGNGRILVLITKEVNRLGNVAGYAWIGDLMPPTVCSRSNVAEIFYGLAPDPGGIFGPAISEGELMEEIYPPLLPHELTHVVQFTGMLFGNAGDKALWEMEGGATLAEKLVGHVVLGNTSRADLGWSAVESAPEWYQDWVWDMGSYFGWSPAGKVPGAPEECTWTGTPSDGNTGPCYGATRAVYGVPAWLLQFMMDRYGEAYPGGDAAAMQRMTQSNLEGFSTLEDVAGESIELVLTRFAAALYTDGRYWDAMASWDLFDIFGNWYLDGQLQPYSSTLPEPALDVYVRGGSTAYLLWAPGTPFEPTTLRIRTPSDTVLPAHMAYWIWRLR